MQNFEPTCSLEYEIFDAFKINNFNELVSLPNLDKIINWPKYVEMLNKDNAYCGNDSSLSTLGCYICGIHTQKHTDKFGNESPFSILFRYKPWKTNWREEQVCTACFYASQNPSFKYFDEFNSYGYKGITTQFLCNKTWYYKDLRECANQQDEDNEFKNPICCNSCKQFT